ncbi:hypothetical protein B0I37DRAFT_56259 [Chaetomium sp. MPI-CAGE-AT-0009]|nr:hypothetical protein B0I37DRAFT_56259 [Chaetomium sp. MPI-CAGE-AT-0009]
MTSESLESMFARSMTLSDPSHADDHSNQNESSVSADTEMQTEPPSLAPTFLVPSTSPFPPTPPATATSAFDTYGEESASIIFRMASISHIRPSGPPSWVAILAVKCDSLSRLMAEGFSWSEHNMMPGSGGDISDAPGEEWTAQGFRYTATWILAETPSQGGYSRWVARLQLVAASLDILASFQPHCLPLPPDTVVGADAWDGLDRLVYHYDHAAPHESYNHVRGGMSLGG